MKNTESTNNLIVSLENIKYKNNNIIFKFFFIIYVDHGFVNQESQTLMIL